MTEAEWLTCNDPKAMVDFVVNPSERKMRLFAIAWCHMVELMTKRRNGKALAILERFADGLESKAVAMETLTSALKELDAIHADPSEQQWYYAEESAAQAVYWACQPDLNRADLLKVIASGTDSIKYWSGGDYTVTEKRAARISAVLLRDVFGNPFRPLAGCTWPPPAVALARTIYEEKVFHRIRELADALERRGFTDVDVLGHCRTTEPHVRGCWVVDLILGKA